MGGLTRGPAAELAEIKERVARLALADGRPRVRDAGVAVLAGLDRMARAIGAETVAEDASAMIARRKQMAAVERDRDELFAMVRDLVTLSASDPGYNEAWDRAEARAGVSHG